MVLTSDVENVPVLPRLVRVLRVGRPAGEVEPGVLPAGAVPVNSTVQYSSVQYSTVQYLAGAILPAVRVWQLRVSWRQVQNWQSVLQPSWGVLSRAANDPLVFISQSRRRSLLGPNIQKTYCGLTPVKHSVLNVKAI